MALAVAQSNINAPTSTATTCAVTLAGAGTNPSLLVVSVAVFRGGATAISVADGGVHTWTAVAAEQNVTAGSQEVRLRSWTAPNTGTGAPTVTATCAANSAFAVVLTEFTGHDTSTPLDGVIPVLAGPTGASPAATGNITPATANALIYGAMCFYNNAAANPPITQNQTLIREGEDWVAAMDISTQYVIQAGGPSAQALSWTIGAGYTPGQWICHAFVIRPAAAGAATSTAPRRSPTLGLRIR